MGCELVSRGWSTRLEQLLRAVVIALFLAAPVALSVADAGGRSAVVGHKDGKIAFSNGGSELDAINSDGSGRRALVRCTANCLIGGYAWSPRGAQLAFLRGSYAGGPPKMWLYVVKARGSRVRRLALCGNCVPWSRVSWSSDGSRIVFARTDGLHVVRVRTRAQRRVTTGFAFDPAWSPTGSRIAFGRGNALYTVDATSGRLEKVAEIRGVCP
jgi:Tol biopolymer transport system component